MQKQPVDTLAQRSFIFFTLTQYFGAFNDNVFKQLMLLLALLTTKADMQGVAMMVFSLPFLLFSGYSGQLSEIHRKTSIMRIAKIWELLIMVLGCLGLYWQNFPFLLLVLFLMGAQSTLFGPSKYGVIPEITSPRLLVSANGIVQMTTFLAIILGTALAGYLMKIFDDRLFIAGLACIFIAIVGIATVYQIEPGEAHRPGERLRPNPFSAIVESLKEMFADKPLWLALIASTFFWFSGGMVAQVINSYGVNLLGKGPAGTSLLMVALACGIMVGCLAAGPVERRIGSKWTILSGAFGVALFEFLLFFYGLPMAMIYLFLIGAGFSTGFYYVPIAAFMQARPPLGKKGNVLAAMNFCSYIGLILSGAIWLGLTKLGTSAHWVWVMLSGALLLLIVVLFPQLEQLD